MSGRSLLCIVVLLAFGLPCVSAQEPKQGEKGELEDFVEIVKLKERRLHDELIAQCRQFLKDYPGSAAAECVRLNIAHSLYYKRDYDRATKEFTGLIEKYPNSVLLAQYYMMRGESLRNTKKFRASISDFSRAAEMLKQDGDKNAAHALYHVGQAYHSLGENEKAKEELENLKKEFPQSPYVRSADALLRRIKTPRAAGRKDKSEEIGKPAIDFAMKDINGNDISLQKYRGKIVLLDFWATWCGPCRAELPNVKRIYEENKDKGFAIIGVSLDSDLQRLKDFIAKEKMEWPQIFDGKRWKSQIAQLYDVHAIPATYLLDEKGIIRNVNLRGPVLGKAVAQLIAERKGKK